jgi:hypothetical protein
MTPVIGKVFYNIQSQVGLDIQSQDGSIRNQVWDYVREPIQRQINHQVMYYNIRNKIEKAY